MHVCEYIVFTTNGHYQLKQVVVENLSDHLSKADVDMMAPQNTHSGADQMVAIQTKPKLSFIFPNRSLTGQ